MVPESLMPNYAFLADAPVGVDRYGDHLRTLRIVGVPYTDEEIASAKADLLAQADPAADTASLTTRYPKANMVPGDGKHVTELDALVAYLQVLGTMVDFADVNTEQLQQ
jgi:cytochrome c oxidase cbb3-type subunit 2